MIPIRKKEVTVKRNSHSSPGFFSKASGQALSPPVFFLQEVSVKPDSQRRLEEHGF
jgi:hypothetical protein